ncbi:kynureninase [Cavenderia fasciculata]|uniref:Kynureninase n=1 Tax=Cavenderia fasciculata TaxID=261658 RepID=F4PWR9_CACFS|nr:kynureninase [Cavenderia fasciculata]EGG20433.1 kynureninase [Cavenderia fasciculata]|eukprot:XP_004367416.1 kynureninase [Cavenderia fasciculata]
MTTLIIEEANRLRANINDAEFAKLMDLNDPLKSFRSEFYIPLLKDIAKCEEKKQCDQEVIYLCGNSLGLQPKETRNQLDKYLNDWQRYAVEGHMRGDHPWISIDEQVQQLLANVVGCLPSECCPMNTLSVNLHMMMVRFYRPTATRHKIVIEQGAFPSDLYVTESQLRYHGFDPETSIIKITPRHGETTLRQEDIEDTIRREGSSIALVMLSGVQFFTGQFFNIEKITSLAHQVGAYCGWDLAHAVNNVELRLHDWNVDFACWCSYKYLNSGPGCIGGLFIHENHTRDNAGLGKDDDPRFVGWFGNKLSNRFHKEMIFQAEKGALGYRCSNPSVADVTALRTSLEIVNRATLPALRAKARLLTGYLEYLLHHELDTDSSTVNIITPTDPAQRGSQLSLEITGGAANACLLKSRLCNSGVVCDVREPSVLRVAPTPLYNSFSDVYNFVQILKHSLN